MRAGEGKTMTEEQQTAIEAACIRLQQRYGTLADRQDPKFRELFADDAAITLPEYPTFSGLDAIMTGQAEWRKTGILMRHVCTNFTIDVKDAAHAEGLCYLMVFYGGVQASDATEVVPTTPISLGEFQDRFVNQDGRWLFQSRTLRRIFRGTEPA
jgi:hypothetical protein